MDKARRGFLGREAVTRYFLGPPGASTRAGTQHPRQTSTWGWALWSARSDPCGQEAAEQAQACGTQW